MSPQVSNLEVSLCMDAKSTPLLGKYELGRLLGRGTFGKVYHARCVADGKAVAVKVLDKAGMAATASLLREVAAMSRLHHPHVLRLHEVLATRARIYLVLELAPGGDLQSRLAALPRRRLPEHTARRLFVQIVSALSCCHAQGVAHRDVKLQNILLDGDGNLKLCDFGFSALPTTLRDDGRLHTACGTPAYAAPEVLRHKAYDGAKADAWSSGVVLFVLLAGYLPFDDANVADMCRKQHRREYVFPRWVTHPARRLVSRLLDPNPANRVSVEALASHQWLNRSLSFDSQLTTNHPVCSLMAFQGPVANAFDIISMSPVLDLSSLFGRSGRSRGKWFMTTASPNHMLVLLGRTGEKLGYLVLTKKGVEGLPRGWFSSFTLMSVQMSEVAPPLMLVELELEDGNGEGQVFDWEELSLELGHVMGCYS